MLKIVKSKADYYLKEFPKETFKSDGAILFCSYYEKAVSISVFQLLNISKHQQNSDRINKFKQQFLNSEPSTSSNNLSTFNTDSCHIDPHRYSNF